MSSDPSANQSVPIVSSGGTSRSGLTPGFLLSGRYELREIRGAGGMGEVWRALHRELDREVAIKVLPAEIAGDAAATKRLRREAGRLFDLRHPNIAAVMDFGVHPEGPQGPVAYLVMELMGGPTLREHMAETGRLELAEAVALLRPVAEALDFAHGKKFVHLDVKPANVLFTAPLEAGGEPKLIDFGIAHEIEETMAMTGLQPSEPVEVMGTPGYMSPEQFQAKRPRPTMDVWATAVMAYQMLADRMPFRGAPSEKRRQIMEVDPDDVEVDGIEDEHSHAVSAVLRWGMRKDPKARPKSVRAFVDALEAAGTGALPAGLAAGPARPAPEEQTTVVVAEPVAAPTPPPSPSMARKVASSPGVADASASAVARRFDSVEFETPAGGSALSGRLGVFLIVLVAVGAVAAVRLRDARLPPAPTPEVTLAQVVPTPAATVQPPPSRSPEPSAAPRPPPTPSPSLEPVPPPSPEPPPKPSPRPSPSPAPTRAAEPPPPATRDVAPLPPPPSVAPPPATRVVAPLAPVPSPVPRSLPEPTRRVSGSGEVLTALPASAYLPAPDPTPPPSPSLEPVRLPPTPEERLQAAGFALLRRNDKGFTEWSNPKDGSTMIYLPARGGKPALLVGAFEVSVAQYRAFVEALGGGEWLVPRDLENMGGDKPVLWVNAAQARAYARWAGGRIPTEAEWIRAARGDAPEHQRNTWPWGEAGLRYGYANYDVHNDRNRPGVPLWRKWSQAVSNHAESVSPIGAFQMAGNAAEYVVHPDGDLRLKGGAWSTHPDSLRIDAEARPVVSQLEEQTAGIRLVADLP